MANPRKFSEKIALHNQKQAEETARFEQIMREVSDATNKMNNLTKQHLHINQTLGSFRGGSLPNVNHVANNTVETKTNRPLSHFEDKSGRTDAQVVYRDRGRSVGVGPMRSRPIEKRIDTSPYGGAYLSPPPDTNWRRTNSDSALHQSTQDVGQRCQHHDSQILGIAFNDKSSEQRPRSCYEDSLVPGINIQPSHTEPGTIQIPIGNNTGSLPDLTSFHFPSPLPTPLDQEDPSSCFNTSPQEASPCTLSPSLSLSSRPLEKFQFGATSQESRVPSPHSTAVQAQVQIHSSAQRQLYPSSRPQNLTVAPSSPGDSPPLHRSSLQNHLTIPTIITSSYLHQSKGVTQDHSATIGVENYSQPKFVYQNPPLSPTLVNCSLSPKSELSPQQTPSPEQQSQQLNTYRNTTLIRPSPQNSPTLSIQQYRSASPGDSHNSASPSPASPVGSPGANTFTTDSNYFINHAQQAAALQQHFEQFNMDWCQLVHSLVESGSGWSAHLQMDTPSASISYITSPNSSTTTPVITSDDGLTQDLGTDAGYFNASASQLQYNRNTGNGSTQQTTPQTPNTPSSIPDIILTDFSSSTTDDLKPSLSSALSGSFESDLFPTDETLRAGLGPIDFDGFQMLTDPDMNVISDPATEDHFRLDRLDRL